MTFSTLTSPHGVQRYLQAKHFQVEGRDLYNLGSALQDFPRLAPNSLPTRGQGVPQHFLHWQPPGFLLPAGLDQQPLYSGESVGRNSNQEERHCTGFFSYLPRTESKQNEQLYYVVHKQNWP